MGRLQESTTDKRHKIEVNKPPTFTCNQKKVGRKKTPA